MLMTDAADGHARRRTPAHAPAHAVAHMPRLHDFEGSGLRAANPEPPILARPTSLGDAARGPGGIDSTPSAHL